MSNKTNKKVTAFQDARTMTTHSHSKGRNGKNQTKKQVQNLRKKDLNPKSPFQTSRNLLTDMGYENLEIHSFLADSVSSLGFWL